ncbi:hypothetical protein [Geobacter sp. SVR]|uniref:hypothetical protein n=1 Tax=Geobacter sp. SVR TaxID=2495594 RepID=UPI00143EF87A|nr:hypothetical protein [Geobacter sp. SVR]BCS54103.1 hypothetical protein GSVR_24110 [Geobacter sp. SVR]GCF87586.1 hypothetical protein GSbR_41860 [Geobacter sp. SVR]
MQVSVSEFVDEYRTQIKEMYGYPNLLADLGESKKRKLFGISNDMIAKKLLSNDYGHVCDESLCKLFKNYVFAKVFPSGSEVRRARRVDSLQPAECRY